MEINSLTVLAIMPKIIWKDCYEDIPQIFIKIQQLNCTKYK